MINLADLFQPLKSGLVYLQSNAWYIVFTLAGAYLIKANVVDPYLLQRREQRSYAEATRPDRVSTLNVDLRRVRAAQQEEASRKAAEAAKEAEKKRAEQLKKKRVKDPNEYKFKGDGRKVNENPWATSSESGSESRSGGRGGYNPMNPSSSHVSGFRPARRTVGRS